MKQAELNALLDLDKNEKQVAQDDPQTEKPAVPTTFVERVRAQEPSREMAQ